MMKEKLILVSEKEREILDMIREEKLSFEDLEEAVSLKNEDTIAIPFSDAMKTFEFNYEDSFTDKCTEIINGYLSLDEYDCCKFDGQEHDFGMTAEHECNTDYYCEGCDLQCEILASELIANK